MAKNSSASLTATALVALAMIASACTNSTNDSASTSTPSTETTSTSPASTTSTASEETTSSTTEETTLPPGEACPAGTTEPGSVTGVFDFVNMRTTPSRSADLLAEVPVNSDLMFVTDSFTPGDDRLWVAVLNGEESCGWVAAEYVKDGAGRLVGSVTADEYVRRALFGLDPEAAHGTYTQDGAEAPEVTLDDTALMAAVAELRQIGRDNPNATVRPDASVEVDEGAPDGVGCIFGDGLFCQVEVVSASGDVVAVVSVSWYGDGITGVDLQPLS